MSTDIAFCTFSGRSYASLNFASSNTMTGCRIIDERGQALRMSRPPVVINGLHTAPVIMLDEVVLAHKSLVSPSMISPKIHSM